MSVDFKPGASNLPWELIFHAQEGCKTRGMVAIKRDFLLQMGHIGQQFSDESTRWISNYGDGMP